MTRYGFSEALGAFFLAESRQLSRLLPKGLRPLEARPGYGVLAVTGFQFTESEVGAYGELVLSVLVPPFAGTNGALPHAATFPVALATTSAASRAHAAQRWLLPEYERCLDIQFVRDGDWRIIAVRDGDTPVLTLRVKHRQASLTTRLYQVFSYGKGQLHRVNLQIEGALSEHQEESGQLLLHPHSFHGQIEEALFDTTPITEQSMDAGEQRFDVLAPHFPEHL